MVACWVKATELKAVIELVGRCFHPRRAGKRHAPVVCDTVERHHMPVWTFNFRMSPIFNRFLAFGDVLFFKGFSVLLVEKA